MQSGSDNSPWLGFYKRTIHNPSAEELIASRLPDEWIETIEICFMSEGGRSYTAAYHITTDYIIRSLTGVPFYEITTPILISGLDKDYDDFCEVRRIVALHSDGKSRRFIFYGLSGEIRDFIHPKLPATQRLIGQAVQGFFSEYFMHVKIMSIRYKVLEQQIAFAEAVEQSGFASERQ